MKISETYVKSTSPMKSTGWSKINLRGGGKVIRYYLTHSVNSKLHHLRKPAFNAIKLHASSARIERHIEYREFMCNDLTHCIEKPAYITEETEDWFYMDWPHCLDGPTHSGFMESQEIWHPGAWCLYGINLELEYNNF